MSYNDSRIRVRRYAGERNLTACILQRYRGQKPSVMVRGAIGYNMEVYSPRYCPSFRKFHMPCFNRTMPGHTWQRLCKPSSKDDGYHCFPGLYVRQACRPSNMSKICFIRQHLLLTLCGLAYKLPQEDIQGLFDSMPKRIETLIAAHGGFTPY